MGQLEDEIDLSEEVEEIKPASPKKKPSAASSSLKAKNGVSAQSRLKDYASGRNSADANTSSRMSPYLASGIISIRMILTKVKRMLGNKLESGRDSGPGTWVMECAWRDFYNHVRRARVKFNIDQRLIRTIPLFRF